MYRVSSLTAEVKIAVERVKGIEPLFRAWEAFVLPLNYTRLARGGLPNYRWALYHSAFKAAQYIKTSSLRHFKFNNLSLTNLTRVNVALSYLIIVAYTATVTNN